MFVDDSMGERGVGTASIDQSKSSMSCRSSQGIHIRLMTSNSHSSYLNCSKLDEESGVLPTPLMALMPL